MPSSVEWLKGPLRVAKTCDDRPACGIDVKPTSKDFVSAGERKEEQLNTKNAIFFYFFLIGLGENRFFFERNLTWPAIDFLG